MVSFVLQLSLTLKTTTAKVVETSVYINKNSPSQDSTNLDDVRPRTCLLVSKLYL